MSKKVTCENDKLKLTVGDIRQWLAEVEEAHIPDDAVIVDARTKGLGGLLRFAATDENNRLEEHTREHPFTTGSPNPTARVKRS